jgi:magnesium-transporting ATPase (P-type)
MFAPVGAGPGKPAYAGAIVRQGEATGQVTATGSQTFFGRTAELVRSSDAPSHMQRTIFAIVKRLVIFDAVLAALVVAFALWHHLPPADTAVFVLMLMVASVPVALPATYTLGTAVSSMQLAHQGVLVTRLPAVEEAAAMDTLVSDKTGTLTQNTLTLAGVIVLAAGSDESAVLRAAALASDDATQDPLDLAILAPARAQGLLKAMLVRQAFHPFDPTTRRSEGVYLVDGNAWHAVKGASNVIGPLCKLGPDQQAALDAAERMLAESGARVLAVAAGPDAALQLLGVVGLADPPRSDAADLIAQLTRLGVRVRMATGDALETARAIGTQLGLGTRVCEAQGDALQDPENCDLFTLNKTLKTLEIVVFLTLGLMLTGSFVISSTLIVLLLFTNDFVTMTIIATDRVQLAGAKSHGGSCRVRWPVPAVYLSALLVAAPHRRSGCLTDANRGVPAAGVHQPGMYSCAAQQWPAVVLCARTLDDSGQRRRRAAGQLIRTDGLVDGCTAICTDRWTGSGLCHVRIGTEPGEKMGFCAVCDCLTVGVVSGWVNFAAVNKLI